MRFLICKFISFILHIASPSPSCNIYVLNQCTRESIVPMPQIKKFCRICLYTSQISKYSKSSSTPLPIFSVNLISRGTFHFKSFQSTKRLSDSRTNAPWNFILRRTAQHRSECFCVRQSLLAAVWHRPESEGWLNPESRVCELRCRPRCGAHREKEKQRR